MHEKQTEILLANCIQATRQYLHMQAQLGIAAYQLEGMIFVQQKEGLCVMLHLSFS